MDTETLLRETSDIICKHANAPAYDWEAAAVKSTIHVLEQVIDAASWFRERTHCADMDDYEYLEVLLGYIDKAIREKEIRYLEVN